MNILAFFTFFMYQYIVKKNVSVTKYLFGYKLLMCPLSLYPYILHSFFNIAIFVLVYFMRYVLF